MQHKKKAPVTAGTVCKSKTKYNTVIVIQIKEDVNNENIYTRRI